MNILSDTNEIFTIDTDNVVNDIIYIKKHFRQGMKYILSDFIDKYQDVYTMNLNFILNHIDGNFSYYNDIEINPKAHCFNGNAPTMMALEAISSFYNKKFDSEYNFDNLYIKPFHFNFDSIYLLLNSDDIKDTYFNFMVNRTTEINSSDFDKRQFEIFNTKLNSIQDVYCKISDCLFIGNEIISEKNPCEIHYYKNKSFCLLQKEEFDFCDKRYQLPDFMKKALQLYFIFSDTKEIIITKNDNQLYNKLIISAQEVLQTLKDKYLLDNSFKNSTILTPNKKRF